MYTNILSTHICIYVYICIAYTYTCVFFSKTCLSTYVQIYVIVVSTYVCMYVFEYTYAHMYTIYTDVSDSDCFRQGYDRVCEYSLGVTGSRGRMVFDGIMMRPYGPSEYGELPTYCQ